MIERTMIESALALRAAGEPFTVATVVAVTGSASRPPGTHMLVARDSRWWRTEGQAPIVVSYDAREPTTEPDELRDALALGFDGVVEILVERDAPGSVDSIAFIARCREMEQRGAIITVIGGELPVGMRLAVEAGGDWWGAVELRDFIPAAREAIALGESRVVTLGGVRAAIEAVVPPPRLFVLGAGLDARPLADIARAIGWDVLQMPATTERETLIHAIDASDRAAVIVMNHDVAADVASLGAALASKAAYIGVLGPRRRTEALLAELGCPAMDPRIRAPVGLAIGAETPPEIALSIVAEVQAVLAGAPASPLRDQPAIAEDEAA